MIARKTTERLARQLAMVRQQKIRKIKARITQGNYRVENKAVARALFVSG